MDTRNFGMGFFGRGRFSFDRRNNLREMWKEMSVEEKIRFMDERAELMGKKVAFFKKFFNMSGSDKNWKDRTYDEKIEFIRSWEEAMEDFGSHKNGFPFGKEFTIELIDKRCQEWLGMTPEEKAESIQKKKEMMHHNHDSFMDGSFMDRNF